MVVDDEVSGIVADAVTDAVREAAQCSFGGIPNYGVYSCEFCGGCIGVEMSDNHMNNAFSNSVSFEAAKQCEGHRR